jgi:hypothetical protein
LVAFEIATSQVSGVSSLRSTSLFQSAAYTIELGDGAMHNRHMNAYLGAEGGCVDVHLSMISRGDIDESLFSETLRRVTLR